MNIIKLISELVSESEFFISIVISSLICKSIIPKYYIYIELASHITTICGIIMFYYLDNINGWWTNKKIIKRRTKLTYIDMIPRVFINLVGSSIIYNNILLAISNKRGLTYNENDSNISILLDILIIYFIYDIFFYIFHIIIHQPLFYSFIHKTHHQTYGDIAISAYYMNFIDYMLEFIIPYWLALYIWNPNYIASLNFVIIGNINGLITHSGYKFYGFPNPEPHQDHHLELKKKYGVGGPWDFIFNTN